ncbi:DUF1206 domain-containing protein [Marivirga salinae]|uniref:DUF1206 domain-containing protein n=1 Tax=Marivirga salinarum TaxID=3059078 RepID=A0AA49J9M5_9BACT|nr:DUF1206 domain-containing protein [Marivirga sp. BDSF4-3]WKK77318.2 DUF1206 domain-containing protein [Marivirga sp. BDSF4-3]
MDRKKEKIARFGIFTKGFVYCLIGALTLTAAISTRGKKTGTGGVLSTIVEQPFGQILLGITAAGLLGYVFWKFYQAIADPEEKGNDLNGLFTRAGYASSGVFYGFLAFTALKMLFFAEEGSGEDNQSFVVSLLSKPHGQILVGIFAVAFLGKAGYQIYIAYSGIFKNRVQAAELDNRVERIIINSGYVGYTARGIVVGIISYLIFHAAFTANSKSAGGTKDAFNFIQNEFGLFVLAVLAVGLFAFGFFLLVKARYRTINI